MAIKIEAGCVQIKGEENTWLYTYTTVEGIHKELFLVPDGFKPEIGDFIENGVLKKRDGPQINPDATKWLQKMRPRKTWGD